MCTAWPTAAAVPPLAASWAPLLLLALVAAPPGVSLLPPLPLLLLSM
jgi:hypothetical protein